jgi:hypothetical protein
MAIGGAAGSKPMRSAPVHTALIPAFGRCASVVEGPAAAPQNEINEHPTRSRRVAGMIQLSAHLCKT